nr:YdeI/OmpD-associated family protein [Halomonas alkalisoli]
MKAAFEALTPGRKRGYILHFSGAKQSSTRTSRIEKCVPANRPNSRHWCNIQASL